MIKIKILTDIGFCGGVKYAVTKAINARKKYLGKRICLLDKLIHNKKVNDALSGLDINERCDINANDIVILPAHGTRAWERNALKENILIDATCFKIKKVIAFVKQALKEKREIIYYGMPNHREALSICDIDPAKIHLISSARDIGKLSINDVPLAYTNQTTVCENENEKIIACLKNKYQNIKFYSAVCDLSSSRQTGLIRNAKDCDVILIIGDSSSNNTKVLYDMALKRCERCYLIEDASGLNKIAFNPDDVIGIASGTSCPKVLITEIINTIKDKTYQKSINPLDLLK